MNPELQTPGIGSPRPWKFVASTKRKAPSLIVDSNGDRVSEVEAANPLDVENARLIVDAINRQHAQPVEASLPPMCVEEVEQIGGA